MTAFVFGAGLRRGIVDAVSGRQRCGTLAELEADLRAARELGAPDDAMIARTGQASVYAVEVMWPGGSR